MLMDKLIHKFSSFDEADKANADYYASLSVDERLKIFEELLRRGDIRQISDPGRMERVFKIIPLKKS